MSLGDIAAGLTTGTHTIELSSLTQYGHYLTLTITETAAASASVRVSASLAVADRFAHSPGRKVGIVGARQMFEGANWTNNFNGACMSMCSLLERLGYDPEIIPLDDASTSFDGGELRYEFLVLPFVNHGGFWTTWVSGAGKPISRIMKGETAIPFFAVGVNSNNQTQLAQNLGAGVMDTATNRKLLWRGATHYMPVVGAYAVVQQAHMSQYAVWQTDSVGGTTGWLYKGARGWVYVSSGYNHPGDCNSFPLMLAEAVMRGHVTAPPQKITAVVDIDDMPASDGVNGVMSISDLDRLYAALTTLRMPNSFGIRPEDITAGRQDATMNAWVAARTADRGGLLHPIVHNGNWVFKDGAKSVKDAAYRADVTVVKNAGIRVGTDEQQLNAWGYTYFNNNACDELTMHLGQPGEDFTASIDGFTAQPGYGWRVARLENIGGNNTATIGEPVEVHAQTWYRGIRLVASHIHMGSATLTADFDDGGAGQAQIALQFGRLIRYGFGYGMPIYIHGQNCYQTGGNAPGTRWLELLAAVHAAGLHHVVQYVHGSALAGELL